MDECKCALVARVGRCMFGCTGWAIGESNELVRGVWQSLCATCNSQGCEPIEK